MSDFYEVEDGLVVSEDGEIIDAAGIDNVLAFVVRKRHEAKAMEAEWERYRRILDTVIIRNQRDEKRVAYGDLVATIAGGTYAKTDSERFADMLSEMPLEADDLFLIIAAAGEFHREQLPESVRDTFDRATEINKKKDWVLTNKARKPAPKLRRVEMAEVGE